jgi:hypothetical protein
MMHDIACANVTASNANMLIPWVLSAAYAYYHLDDPILTDGMYDALCKRLYAEWDAVEHLHKHLLARVWLQKGSIPLRRNDYPLRVRGAASAAIAARKESS